MNDEFSPRFNETGKYLTVGAGLNEVMFYYSTFDSFPLREPNAPQTPKGELAPAPATDSFVLSPASTVSETNRTEPSPKQTFTPPLC
jgi:hypothetical protein